MSASTPNTAAEAGPLRVAAAALCASDGSVLLAQRGSHKNYAGQWEFPGGKIEPGESAEDALRRELAEELGITAGALQPLIRLRHDYPELSVALEVFECRDWRGQPGGLEGQRLAWVAPAQLPDWPLLAADTPIVTALRLPAHYVFTAPDMSAGAVLAGLAGLPEGALLRLRLPTMPEAGYARLADEVAERIGAQRLVVDRGAALARCLGCRLHLDGAALAAGDAIEGVRCIASVHDAWQIARARALGAEAAVLGPVAATASHPGARPLGWEGFEALAAAAGLPVYAIGGLRPADAGCARACGGQGCAGIAAFWPAP